MEKCAKARKSHSALTGHTTRKLNSLLSTIQGITDPACLSSSIISTLESQLSKLDISYEKLEDSLMALMELMDEGDYNTLSVDFSTYSSKIDDARSMVFNVIQEFNKVSATTHVQRVPSTSARKFHTTLKPDDLETTTSFTDFKRWRRQFEDFYSANDMDALPHREQRAHLRSCMSTGVQNTLIHLLELEDSATVTDVLEALQKHYGEALNLMTRRLLFQQCVQKPGETFSEYLIHLKLLGDNAELDKLSYENRLASHIVAFIKDKNLQKELLKMAHHDFKSVKDMCLAWEASDRNQEEMKISTPSITINEISTGLPTDHRKQLISGKRCYRCGSTFYGGDHFSTCPAMAVFCNKCGTKGHFQKVCMKSSWRPGTKSSRTGNIRSTIANNSIFIYSTDSNANNSLPKAKIIVSSPDGSNSREISTVPDTGANECLVSFDNAKAWNLPINKSDQRKIIAANGSQMRCFGSIMVKISFYNNSTIATFFISPDVKNTLLSYKILIALNMISVNFPIPVNNLHNNPSSVASDHSCFQTIISPTETENFKRSLVASYKTVFDCSESFPAMSGKPMHIHLHDYTPNDLPTPCTTARQIPLAYRDAAKAELDDMLLKGIIKPVTQPTDFVSPFLVVPKVDGKVRLVVDYKYLNKFVKRPVHPFPSISDVKMTVPPSAKWFAKLDATKGYWQVPLHDDSQLLTTFLTPWGRFCYTRAPMGLSSSGDEYCLRGDRALEDHKPLRTIANKDLTTIENPRMQRILEKLIPYNFTVDWISGKSHHIPDALSRAPVDKPEPTDVICNIIQARQDPATAKIIMAITEDPVCQLLSTAILSKSYMEVKKLPIGNPVRPYLRYWDRLSISDGLILLDGKRIYIPSSLRSNILSILHSSHQGISRTKARANELYFWIGMDHKPLRTIANKDLTTIENPRMQRILEKLIPYNFTVDWISGKSHHIPDALSRAPVDKPEPTDVICNIIQARQDPATAKIIMAITEDPVCQLLSTAILSKSYMEVKKLPIGNPVRPYLRYWDRLSISMDRYSGWPIISKFNRVPNSASVIAEFKQIFRDYGIPVELRTDGGGQFTSQLFKDFLKTYGINQVISSAHYPQSNGHAEAAVKSMKMLVKKCWDNGRLNQDLFNSGLLEWRNTPKMDGKSPSQWLFGRLLRTFAPACGIVYSRLHDKETEKAMQRRSTMQDTVKVRYDLRSRRLRPLNLGEKVRIKDSWNTPFERIGIIEAIRESGRSYQISSKGSTITRNRRLIKPVEGGM
ncbi:hypothetical protein GQR58_009944 [Nymphon striatum]|nr:hypothetical protein GQR58_009944 [Nymphon striatum]